MSDRDLRALVRAVRAGQFNQDDLDLLADAIPVETAVVSLARRGEHRGGVIGYPGTEGVLGRCLKCSASVLRRRGAASSEDRWYRCGGCAATYANVACGHSTSPRVRIPQARTCRSCREGSWPPLSSTVQTPAESHSELVTRYAIQVWADAIEAQEDQTRRSLLNPARPAPSDLNDPEWSRIDPAKRGPSGLS